MGRAGHQGGLRLRICWQLPPNLYATLTCGGGRIEGPGAGQAGQRGQHIAEQGQGSGRDLLEGTACIPYGWGGGLSGL